MAMMPLPGMTPPPTGGAGMPPQTAVPGAAPSGGPGGMMDFGKMMGALTQRGMNGQLPPEAMTLLVFLAGTGFENFARTMEKLRGPKPTATSRDASRGAPGAAVPPNIAQLAQLAALRGGVGGAPRPMGGMPGGLPGMA